MQRMLITIAVAVTVLAVGAVMAVTIMNRDNQPAATTADEQPGGPGTARRAANTPTEPVADTRGAGAAKVDTAKSPGDQTVDTATKPTEPVDETKATEVGDNEDVKARIATLVNSLSEEEERELLRQLGQRRAEKWMETQKYSLPTDFRLRGLRWQNKGQLKLSDAQQQQVTQFGEVMKPRIEAALQNVWAREAELREQANTLREEGREDEMRAVFEQLGELNRQSNDIKQELDTEFRAMLGQILTAEQMEVINSGSQVHYFSTRDGGGGVIAPR